MNVAVGDVVDEELEKFSANEGNENFQIVEDTSFPSHKYNKDNHENEFLVTNVDINAKRNGDYTESMDEEYFSLLLHLRQQDCGSKDQAENEMVSNDLSQVFSHAEDVFSF